MPTKIKANVCYLGPILDVLLKRWFPLVKVSSPTITTPKNRFRATGYSKRGEIT
jgi:hypothetical protein